MAYFKGGEVPALWGIDEVEFTMFLKPHFLSGNYKTIEPECGFLSESTMVVFCMDSLYRLRMDDGRIYSVEREVI